MDGRCFQKITPLIDMKNVVIVANGLPPPPQTIRELAALADFIIAVDGGASHCLDQKVQPHLLIGDFDSLPVEAVEEFQTRCEVYRFPSRKSDTDLNLALIEAERRGAKNIAVFAAIDGQIDYSLAALCDAALIQTEIEFVNLQSRILILNSARRSVHLDQIGQRCSIFPLVPGTQFSSEGLEWELDGLREGAFSFSNVSSRSAEIRLLRGAGFVLRQLDSAAR
jgi:thiamine pyrophosphokinase